MIHNPFLYFPLDLFLFKMLPNRLLLSLAPFGFLFIFSTSASCEIRVGYSSATNAARTVIRRSTEKKRVTDSYAIAGKNVIPIDGKKKFNRHTVWKINDDSKKWSLTIDDANPRIDYSDSATSTEVVQSSRTENVTTNITGFESTRTRKSLSPFSTRSLPPVIPVSTSVFDF